MKAQVIKYKCCGQIFAACVEPYCYTEKDWLKDLRKYALRGDIVEIVEAGDIRINECQCKKKEKIKPDLFNFKK